MDSIRHDKHGNVVKLTEANTKREYRLFDLPELREELASLRTFIRKNQGGVFVRDLKKIADRLADVIDEKEEILERKIAEKIFDPSKHRDIPED